MNGDEPGDTIDEGRDILAGEYALGLLEGEELLAARGRLAHDAGFADEVEAWDAYLVPLFNAIAPAVPPARVWEAIAAALRERGIGESATGEVVRLRRQVRRWQIGAGVGSGIAAALAGVLVIVGPQSGRVPVPASVPNPPQTLAAPPLAAALAPKGGGSISVVYHPRERRLVALAGDLKPRAGHDLELWVLPPGGAPLALGTVAPGRSRDLAPVAQIAAKLVPGSTIAVSLEPVGGSPTGLPTGPVLATATISPA